MLQTQLIFLFEAKNNFPTSQDGCVLYFLRVLSDNALLIKTQEQPTNEMEAILKTTDSVAGSHMKQFLKHYYNLSFFIAFTNCIFFAIIYLHARQRTIL